MHKHLVLQYHFIILFGLNFRVIFFNVVTILESLLKSILLVLQINFKMIPAHKEIGDFECFKIFVQCANYVINTLIFSFTDVLSDSLLIDYVKWYCKSKSCDFGEIRCILCAK